MKNTETMLRLFQLLDKKSQEDLIKAAQQYVQNFGPKKPAPVLRLVNLK